MLGFPLLASTEAMKRFLWHSFWAGGLALLLSVVLLAGIYGLSKLVKGLAYLVRPQSEHGSIPDIDQRGEAATKKTES